MKLNLKIANNSVLNENEYGYFEILRDFNRFSYGMIYKIGEIATGMTNEDLYNYLKKYLLEYGTEQQIKLFYQVNKSYSVYEQYDVLDCISYLSNANSDIELIDLKNKIMNKIPYKYEFKAQDDKIHVSCNLGNYSFIPFKSFKNNYDLNNSSVVWALIRMPFDGYSSLPFLKVKVDDFEYIVDYKYHSVYSAEDFLKLYDAVFIDQPKFCPEHPNVIKRQLIIKNIYGLKAYN